MTPREIKALWSVFRLDYIHPKALREANRERLRKLWKRDLVAHCDRGVFITPKGLDVLARASMEGVEPSRVGTVIVSWPAGEGRVAA